jgi:hypothetical protein
MKWLRTRNATTVIAAAGGGRSGRTRLSTLVALAGLLPGLLVVTAGTASAGAIVPCPAGVTDWRPVAGSQRGLRWEGYRYTLVSSRPRFAISDAHVLDNSGTDLPVNYMITSERTQTHTVSTTIGISTKPESVLQFLTTTVSVNVVSTISTKLGVTFSLTVPARTRLTAEYGVEVFDIEYYVEAWRSDGLLPLGAPPPPTGGRCEEWGYYPQSTVAPTLYETWKLRT